MKYLMGPTGKILMMIFLCEKRKQKYVALEYNYM